MKRVNTVLEHPLYQDCLRRISEWETDRIFCGHDMAHFLDVARLAYIFNLEQGLGIDRERIYTAALLHDIGRHIQYQDGTPHQLVGLPMAGQIMKDCGYDDGESAEILDAIAHHRDAGIKAEKSLRGILYRADKMSRSCFGCQAEQLCDWSSDKKNLEIQY